MADDFLKRLAEDLLNIEINTIIKGEMSALKMPSSKRRALYNLSKTYHNKLMEFKKSDGTTFRDPVYWQFAGLRSFDELRDRAKTGIELLCKKLEGLSEDAKKGLIRSIKILERIELQSNEVVDLFERKRAVLIQKKKLGSKDGLKDIPETTPGAAKPASHTQSELWNNDIEQDRINYINDLDLSTEDTLTIRKAMDIGIEEIVMQTIINIDGDVTTRIARSLADNPNQTILDIHDKSINTSIGIWSNLINTIKAIAGQTFKTILGK